MATPTGYKRYITLQRDLDELLEYKNPSRGDMRRIIGLMEERQKYCDEDIIKHFKDITRCGCGTCFRCDANYRVTGKR